MITFKVTNRQLFDQKVETVDVSDLSFNSGFFTGILEIEVDGEGSREYQGEHGSRDYEEEFGFVICNVYHVVDKSSEVPSYLYEDGQFGHDEVCAKSFETIEDAQMYIETNSIDGWAIIQG